MSSLRSSCFGRTLTPFLYPAFCASPVAQRFAFLARCSYTTADHQPAPHAARSSHLDPAPDNYSLTPFADRCIITAEAGSGGHGCVSFLRGRFVKEGPPNGGDGGSGGNVYIQAVRGETSLHKLARRRLIKAGRGRNGQGGMKGGERGRDVLITVPVGTIVREIMRHDPIADEIAKQQLNEPLLEKVRKVRIKEAEGLYGKDKWLVFPGMMPSESKRLVFPVLPPPRKSHLAALQPEAPIWLDLDKHMETPMLLAAGAMGGLGNPHFVLPNQYRPIMATRGDEGMKISLQLELKILADLGLVGLPNAGKSTLTRALTNSKARVGNWAFTTLQPNVGTVVLDDHKGRPPILKRKRDGELRENFLIADVPGLVEGAHLDKGLGLGFLRHIERAAVLAFVVDLSKGDAVESLKLLWREVSEYENLQAKQLNADTERRVTYTPGKAFERDNAPDFDLVKPLPFLSSTPISSKPWFVVGTKADLPDTEANYEALQSYLEDVKTGAQPHPGNRENAWRYKVQSVPVSAIKEEGVEAIPRLVMDLLDE